MSSPPPTLPPVPPPNAHQSARPPPHPPNRSTITNSRLSTPSLRHRSLSLSSAVSTASSASYSRSSSRDPEAPEHATLHNPGRSGAPSSSSSAAAAASSRSRPTRDVVEIEMDQLNPGNSNTPAHRRRRSSLMNDVVPGATNSRHRAGSIRQTSPSEAKIAEEDAEASPMLDAAGGSKTEDTDDETDISDGDLQDDEETGLTKMERNKRKKKRLRNARLDQRIARDRISEDEQKEADQNMYRRMVINGGLIGLWYLFSLSISIYNKWMFDHAKLNFPFPLFTTALHMMVQFSLASLVLYLFPRFRPGHSGAHGHGHASDMGRSRHESEPADKSVMTRWFYWTRIGPCGAATGLDIGLGNTSLKFITLTFYTMCKSSSLAFVLLFAFLFRLETPTWRLVAIIATMTLGVVMMVAGEVEFKLSGFLLVISAAFFSGFRWGLTQILLIRNPATSNPFSSIFYLAPVMFLTLTLIALPSEGLPEMIEGVAELGKTHGSFLAPMILLFPGTIAFAMTASEFALLQRTSVVTLSIAGIFKEVVTISAAAVVYDDSLTLVNFLGLLVTMAAIGAYNWVKISKMREEGAREVHRDHLMDETEGVGSGSGSGSGEGSAIGSGTERERSRGGSARGRGQSARGRGQSARRERSSGRGGSSSSGSEGDELDTEDETRELMRESRYQKHQQQLQRGTETPGGEREGDILMADSPVDGHPRRA